MSRRSPWESVWGAAGRPGFLQRLTLPYHRIRRLISGKNRRPASRQSPADFNTLTEAQRQAILNGLRNAEQDAIRRQEADQTTTVVHKIAIKDGRITYIGKGEVPGTLDNQFSMDEYNNNLRLATTSSVYTNSGQYTYNNVYVLDGKMATIGSLTHIAEQETIYSTRFIGDRLYMVTFKRIDPFFVIDLSTPETPKILGKLKIPGYSDYLHPYDATHIIGIGKETTANEWGGVSVSGVKLALFDVSDVANPKQLDKVQIGDAGSDSAALTDHHAFLFDRTKNLLVIPVRAVTTPRPPKGTCTTTRSRSGTGRMYSASPRRPGLPSEERSSTGPVITAIIITAARIRCEAFPLHR